MIVIARPKRHFLFDALRRKDERMIQQNILVPAREKGGEKIDLDDGHAYEKGRDITVTERRLRVQA